MKGFLRLLAVLTVSVSFLAACDLSVGPGGDDEKPAPPEPPTPQASVQPAPDAGANETSEEG